MLLRHGSVVPLPTLAPPLVATALPCHSKSGSYGGSSVFRPRDRPLDVPFGQAADSTKRPPWLRSGVQTSYLLPEEAADKLQVSVVNLRDWARRRWLTAHFRESDGALVYRWDEM